MISFGSYVDNLSEGIINPVFSGNKDVIKIDKMISQNKKKDAIVPLLADFYTNNLSLFKKIESRLVRLIRNETRKFKNVKAISDIKKLDSIVDKSLVRKRGLAQLNDLVRGAVLFDVKKDADAFIKKFLRRNKSMIVGYEEKERGQDNEYGYYGSHHIDLNIDGIIVELQVMTRKLWNYKVAAHEIYVKNRSSGSGPDRFDQHTSKRIFSMANESNEHLPEFTTEELYEMIFDDWKDVDLSDETE